ncbi:phiSA1p31-related protein [Streptomyces chryseus]|uniref:phiSA1p31-related protein n=1 Tax=Streptomyces chryseus TaxID=68186 RepID=UPI00110F96BD|nr:phiSA1p31-related protein [Streptomyces chryseus]GGX26746.1 hypothetical protein GCM10010353_47310 [Streptomyces chryseus]
MTATTFKVGDKVEHDVRGKGEVTYGPYDSANNDGAYLVRFGRREWVSKAENLKPVAAFAVGDKAKMRGEAEPVEILAGPYTNEYRTWFTVKAAIGVTTAADSDLTPLPAPEPIKVGDKVRVLVDDADYAAVKAGDVFTVRRVDAHQIVTNGDSWNGSWHFAPKNVERVTEEPADTSVHNGVTYDLAAKYKDRDGDVWRFERVAGTVRGGMGGDGITRYSDPLSTVVRNYGPLRKI